MAHTGRATTSTNAKGRPSTNVARPVSWLVAARRRSGTVRGALRTPCSARCVAGSRSRRAVRRSGSARSSTDVDAPNPSSSGDSASGSNVACKATVASASSNTGVAGGTRSV